MVEVECGDEVGNDGYGEVLGDGVVWICVRRFWGNVLVVGVF